MQYKPGQQCIYNINHKTMPIEVKPIFTKKDTLVIIADTMMNANQDLTVIISVIDDVMVSIGATWKTDEEVSELSAGDLLTFDDICPDSVSDFFFEKINTIPVDKDIIRKYVDMCMDVPLK